MERKEDAVQVSMVHLVPLIHRRWHSISMMQEKSEPGVSISEFFSRIIRRNPRTIDALRYFLFLIIFTCSMLSFDNSSVGNELIQLLAVVFNAHGSAWDSTPYLTNANVRAKWEKPFLNVTSADGW